MNNHYVKFLNMYGDEHYWIIETNYLDIFKLGTGSNPRSAFKTGGIKILQDAYWKEYALKNYGTSATPLKVILTFTDKIEWVVDRDE